MKYIRSLNEEYFLRREVADILGCSIAALTYLRRHSKTPMGATHQASYGGTVLHLYTPARVAEIGEYMEQVSGFERGLHRPGPTRRRTTTESNQRRSDFDRARTYRNRAVSYRQRGLMTHATDLEHRAAELADKLEDARIPRHDQAHRT